jgi:hypothetical protein
MPAKAKFCGECGARIGSAGGASAAPAAPGTAGSDPILKWFIAGCVVLALHAAAIIIAVRGGGAPGSGGGGASFGGGPAGPGAGEPGRATTDLSSMTPREAADRLYERVATASEAGDTQQVNFFGPMAIQAYANVSPLDADARMHVGLIGLALGDPAIAAAQADTILRDAGTHLFGHLLRARAATVRGDPATARTAFRAFLQGWDAERARRLPEYELHARMLDDARQEARRLTAGP